jgi:hypothetical protein
MITDRDLTLFLKDRADLLRRVCFALTVAVSLFATTVGQETPKAVLVDEFGNLPCGDLLARLDHFYVQLSNNPGSTGFVTIANSPEGRPDSVFQQRWIELYTRFRRFDLNRLKIVRSINEGQMKISFWLLPTGATEPNVDVDRSYEIPHIIKKPFIFGVDELYGQVECDDYNVDIFGKFLAANPNSRANLVFRDPSTSVARRGSAHVVTELVEKHGIARDRIRVFIVKPTKPVGQEPITELWYLP